MSAETRRERDAAVSAEEAAWRALLDASESARQVRARWEIARDRARNACALDSLSIPEEEADLRFDTVADLGGERPGITGRWVS